MFSPKSNVRVTAGVYKGKSGVVVHETPRKLKLKLDDGVTTGLVTHTHTHFSFCPVRSIFQICSRNIFILHYSIAQSLLSMRWLSTDSITNGNGGKHSSCQTNGVHSYRNVHF